MSYIVEIGDESGKSFKVRLTKGFGGYGAWLTLDKGYITENSGKAKIVESNGTLGFHVRLIGGSNAYGIQLNDFIGFTVVPICQVANNQGTGWLAQPWALGIRYGRISWAIKGRG